MPGGEEWNAGRNIEEHETKGMSGSPNSEDNKPNAAEDVHNKPHTLPSVEEESEAKKPAQCTSNPPQRTQQILGSFNTIIRQTLLKIQNAIVFIDRHNGVVTALATIAIAILTAFYVGYAKNQWMVMHAQLEEIRSSSTQTDKLIAASTVQSEASKISAETARQTLIASQRAWLGPNDAKLDGTPVVGKKLNVFISFHNTGKEPARNVALMVDKNAVTPMEEPAGIFHWKNLIFLNKCLNLKEREAGQIIYPSTGFASVTFMSPLQEDIIDEDIVTGKKWLMIEGCFAYKTFGKTRHSAFCYFYKAGETQPDHLGVCFYGNYAD